MRLAVTIVALCLTMPAAATALELPIEGSLSACSARLEVEGDLALGDGSHDCTDGDPTCDLDGAADGICTLGIRACVRGEQDGCTPAGLTRLRLGPKKLARQLDRGALDALAAASVDTCSERADARLTLRREGQKASKPLRVTLRARAADAKGLATLRARCFPPSGVGPTACNQRVLPGRPASLSFAIRDTGTDLDLGWTGQFHSFPLPSGPAATLCLSDCDASTDSSCAVSAVPDTSEAPRGLMPPLPLLSAGVPVCAVSRFTGAGSGTFDLVSGALDVVLPVAFDVHTPTPFTEICPRCNADGGIGATGTCSSSAAQPGKPCVVDGLVHVPDSGGNKDYRLSRDCQPSATLNGSIALDLPLTTATATLTGTAPLCPGGGGITPRAHSCGDGTCTPTCTGPHTCDTIDASGRCIAELGGISQACCSNNGDTACFEGGASGSIARDGSPAGALLSPWPDASYPKTGQLVLASTTCFPGTESNQLNSVSGLSGPAALLLPVDVTVETAP